MNKKEWVGLTGSLAWIIGVAFCVSNAGYYLLLLGLVLTTIGAWYNGNSSA